ncbi:unnamed protein product [Bursaphelenchus xylophilus]|uniref:HECT-type E3 ubiquitin transferase n=1 Tax=Bursaphelenchus xylophilus TaxID=6326 RepID=A0A7I8WUE1_BURXY|nr:unnamed protein product [Bursaphelenchus xylophilus]CAG9116407.1 unnamed protein product [Bursaphelenchus xylophilus]
MVDGVTDLSEFCRQLESLVELCGQTGKVEMSRYFEVLNKCDSVLRVAIEPVDGGHALYIDVNDNLDHVLIAVLKFTAALFENSFSRSVYNSFGELIKLLDTRKTKILIYALRVMVAISKTSRYISQHVDSAHQKLMNSKLTAMTHVCPETIYGPLSEVINLKEHPERHGWITFKVDGKHQTIRLDENKTFLEQKAELFNMSKSESTDEKEEGTERNVIISELRFFYSFDNFETRLECIISKLMAISSLFYSRCLLDDWGVGFILNEGLVEEVCVLVQLDTQNYDPSLKTCLDTLKTEALKALASIVFLEKPRKLQLVVDTLGFNSFLGYGASLVRRVVENLKKDNVLVESPGFVTALFSLIYHIAGFEYAGNALVSVSTIPTLLEVVSLTALPDAHLSFSTRAVRIIDILTSINFTEFNNHNGLQVIVNRLIFEVGRCEEFIKNHEAVPKRKIVVHHYRSALIKSLLNFMKRAVVDSNYGNHVRTIMEGDLPKALVKIIENPQFFGASLLYCALDLPTVFIFQEPAQLNLLQDQGLSNAIIDLFFNDDFPVSREIIASLPNICSALCLNERGLKAFNERKPLERILKLIFSAKFVQTLKKRKNELNDLSSQLGTTFDELMRHQPTLRKPLISALADTAKELIDLTQDPNVQCVQNLPVKGLEWKKPDKNEKLDLTVETSQSVEFESVMKNWKAADAMELDQKFSLGRNNVLVVNIVVEKESKFEMLQDNLLLSTDFVLLFSRIIESILSNSNISENSNVMMECDITNYLLKMVLAEKPILGTQNQGFMTCFSNICRLFLQTRKISPYSMLAAAFRKQMKEFEAIDKFLDQIKTEKTIPELSRLFTLAAIFANFNKHSLNINHEIRALILHYVSSDPEGVKLIPELFESIRRFSLVISKVHIDHLAKNAKKEEEKREIKDKEQEKPSSASQTQPTPVPVDAPLSSLARPVELRVPVSNRRQSVIPSSSSAGDATALCNVFRCIVDIVEQIARNCNSTRIRRGNDPYQPSVFKIPECLFLEMKKLLDLESIEPDVRSCYASNVLPLLRKLLFDDSRNLYSMMVSFFYETGCHKAFFNMVEVLVQKDKQTSLATINSWLNIAQRLVTVDSMLNSPSRNRTDRNTLKSGFDIKKYVGVCQRDALKGLSLLFNEVVEQNEDAVVKPTMAADIDLILAVLKDLIHGIITLKNQDRSSGNKPLEALTDEINHDDVNTLIDMGFSRSEALEALSIHGSVTEAADYLLTSDRRPPAAENIATPTESSMVPTEGNVEEKPEKALKPLEKMELSKEDGVDFQKSIKYLCEKVVPLCLKLLQRNSSIIYSIADLLKVFIHDQDASEWLGEKMVDQLFVSKFDELISSLLEDLSQEEKVVVFGSHCHLICLLWSGFDEVFIRKLEDRNLYSKSVDLLTKVIEDSSTESPILAPLLLWIDLYEKEWELIERAKLFNQFVEGSVQWFYWPEDERFNSLPQAWKPFPPICNKEINTAFKAGRTDCRITHAERTYTIDFVTMTQKLSERSGQTTPIYGQAKFKQPFSIAEFIEAENILSQPRPEMEKLISSIIFLLERLNDSETSSTEVVFSAVSLLLRLTAFREMAAQFIEADGITKVLTLRCNKPNVLMTSVLCLILRNCIDNEKLNKSILKEMMSDLSAGNPICLSDLSKPVSSKQRRYQKDFRRLLKLLAPLTGRDLNGLIEITKSGFGYKENWEYEVSKPSQIEVKVEENEIVNLKKVVDASVAQLIEQVENPDTSSVRVLQTGSLLHFVAELCRTYSEAAEIITRKEHNGISFLRWILEKVMLENLKKNELQVAGKAVFVTLLNVKNTPECNEVIAEVVKDTLNSIVKNAPNQDGIESEKKAFCERLTAMARFLSLLKECSKVKSGGTNRDQREQFFIRKVDAKNLLVSFAHTLWFLPLKESYVAEAANSLLRVFEEFSRSIGVLASYDKSVATAAEKANAKSEPIQNPGGEQQPSSSSQENEQQQPRPSAAVQDQEHDDGINDENPDVLDRVMAEIEEAEILSYGVFGNEGNGGFAGGAEYNDVVGSPSRSQSSSDSSDADNNQQGDNPAEIFSDDEDGHRQQERMEIGNDVDVVGDRVEDDYDEPRHDDEEEVEMREVHEDVNDNELNETFDVDNDDDAEGEDDEDGDDDEMETEDETAEEDEQSQDNQPEFGQRVVDVNEVANGQNMLFQHGDTDLMTASVNFITDYISNYYRGDERRTRDADFVRGQLFDRAADLNFIWRPSSSYLPSLTNGAGTLGSFGAARTDSAHPLLRRPIQIPARAAGTQGRDGNQVGYSLSGGDRSIFNDAVTGAHQIRHIDFGIEPVISRASRNRAHQSSRHVPTLRRQGALRNRIYGFSRLHPEEISFFEGQLHNLLNFTEGSHVRSFDTDNARDAAMDRRSVESFVPYYLDRITDFTRLLNAQSVHYIEIIISSYLIENCKPEAKPIEKKLTPLEEVPPPVVENPVEENAAVRNEEDEGQSAGEASVDSSELSNRFADLDQNEEEDGISANVSQEESTLGSVGGSRTPEAQETNLPIESAMEVSSPDPQPETVPPQTTSPMEATEVNEEQAPGPQEPSEEPQPGPSGLQNEQFRAILGDVDIPEGIDPAFLAALPEDIRSEVIRDHQRQQRLQRLSQEQQRQRQQATGSSDQPAVTESAPEGQAPAVAHEEDVLDQDFLAALPPELQEEVLAQNEQRLAARNQQNAQNRPEQAQPQANVDPAVVQANENAALFESLTPSLRASLLADADESVLQFLPANLLAEATRLRQNMEHQNLIRMARTLPPGRSESWRMADIPMEDALNHNKDMVQIFDKESITTIALLYFLERDRFSLPRFQRLFKVICGHSGTCDFVLRSLLGMLQAASDDSVMMTDDELSSFASKSSWFSNFKVQSAIQSQEQALVVTKDKVFVNKLIRTELCNRILETIASLARQCSINFFPSQFRFQNGSKQVWQKPPVLSDFWETVRKMAELIDSCSQEKIISDKPKEELPQLSDEDFKNSPFGLLLAFSTTEPIVSSPQLQEKVLRIFHTALHTPFLANNKNKIELATGEEGKKFLMTHLEKLIVGVMDSVVYDDSFRDCRSFLVQLLYVFPQLRYDVFVILFDVIKRQGIKLADMLRTMKVSFEKSGKLLDDEEREAAQSEAADKGVATSVEKKSQKQNSPKRMLRSLNTVSFVRSQLAEMNRRKKPAQDAANDEFIGKKGEEKEEALLYQLLDDLDQLWKLLSECLDCMSKAEDNRAVMSLQYVAEAYFLSHALTINSSLQDAEEVPSTENANEGTSQTQGSVPRQASTESNPSTSKAASSRKGSVLLTEGPASRFTQGMLGFAERHRTVLNQILRSSNNNVMEDSAFAVLTYFPKLLDFDVKRKYFYKEIRKLEDRTRFRQEDVPVRIRRNHLFSDSFRELFRLRSQDWKSRFYIIFEGEEGQDAGGLLREWYSIITREVFNPNYALFITAPGDGVTYMVNRLSYVNPEHLEYFKFVGRIIAKAIYDNKQLDCYFTRAFYKHILNLPIRYQDIESEDPEYYKNLKFLLDNPLEMVGVDLHFNLEVEEFGVRNWRELKEGGNKLPVNDENKEEYVKLVCQMKMADAVRKQLDAFLSGFYEIIPKKLISIFNEQELELLVSGLPDIDIDDLYNNTEYKQYSRSSPQIQWFWRALRSFEKEDLAKFLQFVTGTSKVPLQGFAHLEGMNGAQKFTIHMDSRSSERLPCAHTCFNQLDLPQYESYEQLRKLLLIAVRECTEGFAFA